MSQGVHWTVRKVKRYPLDLKRHSARRNNLWLTLRPNPLTAKDKRTSFRTNRAGTDGIHPREPRITRRSRWAEPSGHQRYHDRITRADPIPAALSAHARHGNMANPGGTLIDAAQVITGWWNGGNAIRDHGQRALSGTWPSRGTPIPLYDDKA